jgi:acyl-CoA thioesterase-1
MNHVKYLCMLLPLLIVGCKKSMYDEAEYRKKIGNALVKKVSYLALGDSYTKGQSVPLAESFPYILKDSLNKEPFIEVVEMDVIAETGWTTTNLLNALSRVPAGKKYDLVTLLIGVNNQYQGKSITSYKTEFTTCLQKAITFAGGDTSRVIVISIPDYGYTPFGASNKEFISSQIDTFNAVNRSISESMNVSYIDITTISRSDFPDLVASDGLHPSGKQYKFWVDKMYAEAKAKIQKY